MRVSKSFTALDQGGGARGVAEFDREDDCADFLRVREGAGSRSSIAETARAHRRYDIGVPAAEGRA